VKTQKLAPPRYRLHKARGCAVCTIDGRNYYLGPYQSPESLEAYARLLGEWRGGKLERPEPPGGPTVGAVCLAYLKFAEGYYRKNGEPTSQIYQIRSALRFACEQWNSLPAVEFGPLRLKMVRETMIEAGLARTTINRLVQNITAAFRWAASEEICPPSIPQGLATVAGLRAGRTEARETAPVLPVAADIVEQTLKHCGRIVGAMVRLQELTGMRPGELVQIRPQDITLDLSGCAVFRPENHKTEHHGRERQIFIGPRGLEILRPFLNRPPEAYCFSPAEAFAEHHAERGNRRATPRYPSHMARNRRKRKGTPNRAPRERFDVDSYARAVARACERAYPVPPGLGDEAAQEFRERHHWRPNRLRHNFATNARRVAGLEATAAALGHSEVGTTQIYAEADLIAARELLRKIG